MAILFRNVDIAAGVASESFTFRGAQKIATVRADDFGGGTIALQSLSINDATPDRWDDLLDGVFTANGQVRIDFASITLAFRAQLIGGSGATNVFVEIA